MTDLYKDHDTFIDLYIGPEFSNPIVFTDEGPCLKVRVHIDDEVDTYLIRMHLVKSVESV